MVRNTVSTESISTAILGIIIFIANIPLYGYTGMTIWNWFMPSLGIPTIGLMQAFGLALVVRFLTHVDISFIEDKRTDLEKCLLGVFMNLFTLAFGALYHWLMVMP